jgi:segregation and condensation protein A
MTYEVSLDIYQGPFDLLLQLIARRSVDIMDVDLADITNDFVAFLDAEIERLDLETATRFLLVAATLIEIKAVRLLPKELRDESGDVLVEARDVLYARLLEYRAYREAAYVLDRRFAKFADRLTRDGTLEPWMLRLVPDVSLPIDARGLGALAAQVLSPKPPEPVALTHIRRSTLSLRDAARQLLDAIMAHNETSFASIAETRDRSERVALFLACLELYKLGAVDLDQPDRSISFTLRRRFDDQTPAKFLVDIGDDTDMTDSNDRVSIGVEESR